MTRDELLKLHNEFTKIVIEGLKDQFVTKVIILPESIEITIDESKSSFSEERKIICLLKDFVAQLDTWGYTICKKKEDEE